MSITITYWRHTTIQLEIDGTTLLFDPSFGGRHWWMPRLASPPREPSFKKPDAILITQSHYDHLDLGSFKYLPSEVPLIIPLGYSNYLQKLVRNPLVELEGYFSEKIGGVTIRAVPLTYESFRLFGLLYRNAQAYLIEAPQKKILFIPDGHLSEVALASLPSVDILIAPVMASRPQWLNRRYQMTPREMERLIERLQVKDFFPINRTDRWDEIKKDFENLSSAVMHECGSEQPTYV